MAKKKVPSTEETLVILHGLAQRNTDDYYATKARNILGYYQIAGELTIKQRYFIRDLSKWAKAKDKSPSPPETAEYYLYAISDGRNVKLGFAKQPAKRLKALQTSNRANLKLLWTLYAGDERNKATKAERKLHRYCRKYHKNREWFSMDCMELVNKFTLEKKPKKQEYLNRPQIEQLEIAAEASKFI